MTDLSLEVVRDMPFPRERVFDAWLNAEMLAKFMVPAEGMTVPEAWSDSKVGGRFKIVMQAPDGTDIPHAGEYKVIDRAEQIEFTWESPYSVDDSTVTIDFEIIEKGTRVRLRHVRFPSEEARDNHQNGWTLILAKAEEVLA